MLSSSPPVISIKGPKGPEKKQLLIAATKRLTARGYRIALIDTNAGPAAPAPDAAQFQAAGAAGWGRADAGGAALFLSAPAGQQSALFSRAFQDCHLIFLEDSLQPCLDAIEIVAPGKAPLCRAQTGAPCFSADDTARFCDFIEARYLQPQLSAAIMAGGKSSRLGKNKALLPLGDSTVIGQVLAAVAAVTSSISLITNSPQEYGHLGLTMAGDIRPGCGPLSGIHAALSLAAAPYVLVQSCDIPLITPGHLNLLCQSYPGQDITIFKTARFQPLCAIYRRTCLPVLEELIDHGEYRIIDLFPSLQVRVLRTDDEQAFRSINTQEDYDCIHRAFGKQVRRA